MIILQFFVNSDDATKVNLSQTFEPISWTHLLGTDDYGRDLFTRVIVGAINIIHHNLNFNCYCYYWGNTWITCRV